jgi:hypothetical protein
MFTGGTRRQCLLVGLLLVLTSISFPAFAEKRFALLIGNEAYESAIGRLGNPHNDVALLEQALKGLGFEVAVERDDGLGALTRAVNAYVRRLHVAGPNAVGFFYYSGHGASDGSTNYLIPVDVKTTEPGELWDQSLRLTEITRKLKAEAGNATHFVVFDACRNTLKLTQPGSRALVQAKGFVPVAQESGMLIAYSTAENELASDVGVGAGPYSKVLAEEIVKPGIEAVSMFRVVQRRVRIAISQEPYLGFNALGDVYLGGKPDTAAPPGPPKTTAGPTYEQQAELTFWSTVKDSKDPAVLQVYLDKYPSGTFAELARQLIAQAKRESEARRAEAAERAAPKPTPNTSNSAAEIMSSWDMIGTWATNCRLPPGNQNTYLSFVVMTNGRVSYEFKREDKAIYDVFQARITPNGSLEFTGRAARTSVTWQWTFVKGPNESRRMVERGHADGSYQTIKNGRGSTNGRPSSSYYRCR